MKENHMLKEDNDKMLEEFYERHKKRNPKGSRGYEKFIEYVEELRRNIYFKKDLKKFEQFYSNNYKKNKRKDIDKKILNLCKKYNIPVGTLEGLGGIKDGNRFEMGWAGGCKFNYDMNEQLDLYAFFSKKEILSNYVLTKNKKVIYESFINCYPIAIALHKFSTKRDLLGYIEKNWKSIEGELIDYRKKQYIPRLEKQIDVKRFKKVDWQIRKRFLKSLFTKPYIGRIKRMDGEIVDFIWENRNLGSKEIKKRLDDKFPKNGLIYNEILKIKSLEKKRRNYKDIILKDISEKITIYLKKMKNSVAH
jgi:hypothetical protein